MHRDYDSFIFRWILGLLGWFNHHFCPKINCSWLWDSTRRCRCFARAWPVSAHMARLGMAAMGPCFSSRNPPSSVKIIGQTCPKHVGFTRKMMASTKWWLFHAISTCLAFEDFEGRSSQIIAATVGGGIGPLGSFRAQREESERS